MESKAIVSCHGQNESKNMQNTVNVIHSDEYLSTDLTHVNGVVSHSPPPLMLPQSQNQVHDEIPVATDPLTQGAVNFGNYGGGQGGIFQAVPYENHNHIYQQNIGSQNFEDQNMITMAFSPQPSQPLINCSCCELLREIRHTNGTVVRKLEIHGTLGMIYHAIMRQQNVDEDLLPGNYQHCQMFDFSRKSVEEVRQFLLEYCLGQTLAGYGMLPAPIRALRVGFHRHERLADGFNLECSLSSEESSVGDRKNTEAVSSTKNSISAQRERAGKLTLQELSSYFHLPIEAAAKQVNLCSTVVKKVCRQHGLFRWPYRKMKGAKRRMSILRKSLGSGDEGVRARAGAEIQKLEQEITQHCAGILPSAFHFD